MTITPVLLCGGSGKRLWPLSRESYPKQFVPFFGGESLFQSAARRFDGPGFAPPMVVTGSRFRFIVTQQLASVGVDPGRILLEPEARNTGPAVFAAVLDVARNDPEGLVLFVPSDHLIPDPDAFTAAVRAGTERAESGDIVTFGITPDQPETGYGYLELAAQPSGGVIDLARFVEKPELAQAEDMVASGNFLWNSGIFLGRADAFVAAFATHSPEIVAPVRAALAAAKPDLGFLRLGAADWADAPSVSVDHAVMEKASNLAVVPYGQEWSDLGSWNGVWQAETPDGQGVATAGPATAIDCENTLLRSETADLEVVGLGLKDVVVVAMPDAVLVADRTRSQEVSLALETLDAKGAKQARQLPRDYRPWGWFETLSLGNRYQVKCIVVHPGASLSLQSHVHRAEHWVVVAGSAEVTIGDDVKLVPENQSVFVPLGAVHRLSNPGKVDLHLIEVQTGAYLGEDDIVRYDDVYARNAAE